MPSEPLTSWKAIAAVFGRDVRTVQRWEKEEGLPVQRHLHQRRSSVYADRDALEAWWRHHRAVTENPEPLPLPSTEAPRHRLPLQRAAVAAILLAVFVWLALASRPGDRTALAFQVGVLNGVRAGAGLSGGAYGDVNGDGRLDLVIGAPAAREAYVVLHGVPGTETSIEKLADAVVSGTENAQLSPATVGDFNGDGIDDVLFCTALLEPDTYSRTGSAYIVFGVNTWPRRIELPRQADVTIALPYSSDARMGANVRSPRDLNGDGIDDLVLGAPEYGSPDRRSAGAVIVLRGRRSWPRTVDALNQADAFIVGSRAGEGLTAGAIGNFDGDRTRDVAALAKESTIFNLRGGAGRGYLFRGPVAGVLDAGKDFTFRIDGSRPSTTVPLLHGADVNGDGTDDFIVFRLGTQKTAGEVRIWLGTAKLAGILEWDRADAVIGGGPGFGVGVVTADMDGDGVADLLVGDAEEGALILIYGRRNWGAAGSWREHGGKVLFDQAAPGPQEASVADIDGDLLREIVLTTASDQVGDIPGAGRVRALKPFRAVKLDLRPGFEPNVVLVPNWILVARIYGFSKGRGDEIEPASIRLHGAAPKNYVVQDYDGDGALDVQAFFNTGDMNLRPDLTRLAVTARTRSGRLVGGTDSIVIRPVGGS